MMAGAMYLMDLRSGLALAALVVSAVALAWAIQTVLSVPADGITAAYNKSAKAIYASYSAIKSFQTVAGTLLVRAQSVGEAINAAQTGRQRYRPQAPAADPRYGEFLSLLDEWSRLSSLRLPGAAAACRAEIAGLARPGLPIPSAKASEERFARSANSLVEYLVEATDTKFKQTAPASVEAALAQMVQLAGRELICPERCSAWDPSLHEVVDTMARGPNRPGTIAIVSTRGLQGGVGRIVKARVFLYDD